MPASTACPSGRAQGPGLRGVCLRISDRDRSVAFYRDRLGMRVLREERCGDARARLHLAFPTSSHGALAAAPATALVLEHGPALAGATLRSGRDHVYWKIGVTLSDVDRARARLLAAGERVSEPAQFEDIGYLCHLQDPDGYSIELLQRTFAPPLGSPRPAAADDGSPLAEPGILGQITLRVRDIAASRELYERRLGMRLLSIQPVARYGFTLYFLAYTDERPPEPDLRAVHNREWLWQRPYTTLELLHRDARDLRMPDLPHSLGEDHGRDSWLRLRV